MSAWLLALMLADAAATSRDACEAQVPVTLLVELLETYPDHRVPRVDDNLADDVGYDHAQGGDGCLGIGRADFDGDGDEDFALGLSAHRGDSAVVVAALRQDEAWQLHELERWPDGRSRLFVDQLPARTWTYLGLEVATNPGEVLETMICPSAGVVFGATEASAVVACFLPEGWRSVVIGI